MPPEGSATAAVLEAAPLTAQPEAAAPQPAQAAVEAPPRPPPSVVTPAQQPTQPPAADDDADDTQQPSTSGRAEEEQHQQSSKQATTTRRYMAYFLQRLWDFREPELRALASMYGVDDLQVEPVPQVEGDAWPVRFIQLPDDSVAQKIVQRALLTKGIFEVWGEGSSFEEMLTAVAAAPDALKAPYTAAGASFKVVMSTVGFKWRPNQYRGYIFDLVRAIGFEGDVELENPDHMFWVVTIESDGQSGLPEMPTRWIFGRQVAVADDRGTLLNHYALPQRAYIGPTSMDPELAFIMTNMGHVRHHSLVMDPYVGTGSILVAAAARGAYTFGCDIDHRVVMAGKAHPTIPGAKLTVTSNYEQYGLMWPLGLLRADVHRHPFRAGLGEVFDAIVGDPPYGVRAGGRKSHAKPNALIRNRDTYIPSTAPYSLTECLTDLLELAAVMLVTGGRLVFWMPSSPELYSEEELPQHPMLSLLHNSQQVLSSRYGRRLITMVKTRPYDSAAAAAFKQEREGYVMALDRLSELVYAQQPVGAGEGGAAGEQQQAPSVPKFRSKHY